MIKDSIENPTRSTKENPPRSTNENPPISTNDKLNLELVRNWIEEIKSSKQKYLTNHLMRYTGTPCTSQAYFDPSGERIFYASRDKILIKEAREGGVDIKECNGHRSNITSLAISKKRNEILSGGENGDIIIFCINEGKIKNRIQNDHSNKIKSLVYSKNGTKILSGSKDATMKILRVR